VTAEKNNGVMIVNVEPRSIAAASGLKQGDIIIGVNKDRVANLAQLRELLAAEKVTLALNIKRDNQHLFLVLR
jgi:serine protease DegQ